MENGLLFFFWDPVASIDTCTSLPQGASLSTDSFHYKEWSPKNLNNLDTTFSAFILQAAKTCWHYKTFRIIKNISAKLGIPAWMWNISISTKFWFLPESQSFWSFKYEGVLLTRSNMGMLSPWVKDMTVRLPPADSRSESARGSGVTPIECAIARTLWQKKG
jgi:hypothetical protein